MEAHQFKTQGEKFSYIFKPIIEEALKSITAEYENKEGAYYMDVHRVTKEQSDNLAKKGIPKVLIDVALF
jgi:hypothetical protein